MLMKSAVNEFATIKIVHICFSKANNNVSKKNVSNDEQLSCIESEPFPEK